MENQDTIAVRSKAARVVGFVYLFAMATSMFAEGYVRGNLIDHNSVITTADNIVASRQLFRLGVGAELLTYAADIVLIACLYVILAPVNRHLAILAAFFRLIAESVAIGMAANSFDVLRFLGDSKYLDAFQADQLAALARVSLGAHDAHYGVAFVFLGVGSAIFAYIWMKSNYIPKSLSILGVFASILISIGAFAYIIFPPFGMKLYPFYMMPMFIFEVTTGLWLLIKGIRSRLEI
jgi:hypothetical protein